MQPPGDLRPRVQPISTYDIPQPINVNEHNTLHRDRSEKKFETIRKGTCWASGRHARTAKGEATL